MANTIANTAVNSVTRSIGAPQALDLQANVGDCERVASIAGGAALVAYGIRQKGIAGLLLPMAGGLLTLRGLSGYCSLYALLGIDGKCAKPEGANAVIAAGTGVRIESSVMVNRPARELHEIWRQFDRLPEFMSHIQEVTMISENRSHWVARAPLGLRVEWDAEVYYERPGEMITWRSRPGSDIDTAGSVHFESQAEGTIVRVNMKYDAPAGKLGIWLARLFGQDAEQHLRADLLRFKKQVETEPVLIGEA